MDHRDMLKDLSAAFLRGSFSKSSLEERQPHSCDHQDLENYRAEPSRAVSSDRLASPPALNQRQSRCAFFIL